MDALIVIDLQCGMFADPQNQPHDGEAVVERVTGLIAAARAGAAPVIYIQHDGGEGDVLAAGTPGFPLRPELAPRDGDKVIVKRFCSAFQETDLAEHLAALAVNHVILCGMATEYCVDTSCRAAFERGLRVTLAKDAHTTFDGADIPAAAIIRHHNITLRNGGFVTLADAATIKFET